MGAGAKPASRVVRSGCKHPRVLLQLRPQWHFPIAQISVGLTGVGMGRKLGRPTLLRQAGFAHGVVQQVKTQPNKKQPQSWRV